ncbi:response regulator [bacterium]|nr:MAG: response regulator [bacterium]
MAKILIVDDESNIRLMLRLALQADGHAIETAADGPEALDKFGDGGTFDLVLLDQRMPAMEGIEVLRSMKKRDADTKVVMVTAFGTVDLAVEAQRAGAVNFLRKPFTTDVLRGAVAAALENRAASAPVEGGTTLEGVAVNGFRIEATQTLPQHSRDGNFAHQFSVLAADGTKMPCEVVFPAYFVELVKAHADRDKLDENNRFWLWLGEEALANYLWQNAMPPVDGTLVLEELSSNLRRWMDAVLAD